MSNWQDLAHAVEKIFSSKVSENNPLVVDQLKAMINEVVEQHKMDNGLQRSDEITMATEERFLKSEEEFSSEAEEKFGNLLEAMKELGIC